MNCDNTEIHAVCADPYHWDGIEEQQEKNEKCKKKLVLCSIHCFYSFSALITYAHSCQNVARFSNFTAINFPKTKYCFTG